MRCTRRNAFAISSFVEILRLADRRTGEEIPAQRIHAVLPDDGERLHHVPFRLGHLLPELVVDESDRDHILVWRFVAERRRDRHQGVEPAARLVHAFRNIIGGIIEAGQLRDVRIRHGKRIMRLRVRHRARVVPDVRHLRHAAHLRFALRARRQRYHPRTADGGPPRRCRCAGSSSRRTG